ncbi:hypothetical protein ACSNOH_15155 [Streptomyces sp. URMC 127]|uniref:hypothetical protein n=1 Tax=Streptomyces sp. URMC 127 TaxID=3423402 RepID=UPI003F1A80D4
MGLSIVRPLGAGEHDAAPQGEQAPPPVGQMALGELQPDHLRWPHTREAQATKEGFEARPAAAQLAHCIE